MEAWVTRCSWDNGIPVPGGGNCQELHMSAVIVSVPSRTGGTIARDSHCCAENTQVLITAPKNEADG